MSQSAFPQLFGIPEDLINRHAGKPDHLLGWQLSSCTVCRRTGMNSEQLVPLDAQPKIEGSMLLQGALPRINGIMILQRSPGDGVASPKLSFPDVALYLLKGKGHPTMGKQQIVHATHIASLSQDGQISRIPQPHHPGIFKLICNESMPGAYKLSGNFQDNGHNHNPAHKNIIAQMTFSLRHVPKL